MLFYCTANAYNIASAVRKKKKAKEIALEEEQHYY